MDGAPDTMSHRMEDEITTARVDGGRMLVVSWSGELAREVFEELVDNDIKRSDPDSALGPDGITNDDGPNHRGTYSKAYVRAHPEIKWIHRGQGRYLPATQARSLETVSSSA